MTRYLILRNFIRKFRKLISRSLGKLSFFLGLSPVKQVFSLHDPYWNSPPNRSWEWHCLYPPQRHQRQFPTLYGKIPRGVLDDIDKQQKHTFPQGGFVEGPGHIYGAQGAILMGEGDLLLEPSRNIGTNILEHRIFRTRLAPPSQYQEKMVFAYYDQGQNFFHWITDILPLLLVPPFKQRLSEISATVVLPKIRSRFQSESLALLGLDRLRTIPMDSIGLMHCENVFVPILPQTTGQVHPKVREVLRTEFHNAMVDTSPIRSKRVYISRRQGTRSVLNEEDLLKLLIPLGFNSVCLEELSLVEQISLFSQAEFVVAPHGAGLTHILFLPANASVVELFSDSFYNGCYWRLACLGSHPYTSVFGKSALHNRIPEIDNYYINPDDLALAVRCLL